MQVYRRAQLLTILLNDGFKSYLLGMPITMLGNVAMLIFGTIRFIRVSLLSYWMFPFCGIRCLLDALTLFAIAGQMNQQSGIFLKDWEKNIWTIRNKEERNFQSKVLKSCQPLCSCAGSVYKFETAILLISLDICTQLTFNLLVTYP